MELQKQRFEKQTWRFEKQIEIDGKPVEVEAKVLVRPAPLNTRAKKTRIYFEIAGENILQNLQNRLSRPIKFYRQFLPEVFQVLGAPDGSKATWSRYAGCSCPCSPGFIVTGDDGRDVWVELKSKEALPLNNGTFRSLE